MTRPRSSAAVERKMMTSLNARRLVARDFAGGAYFSVLRAMCVLALIVFATASRADPVDDTLAKFLDDKSPKPEAAVHDLPAEAPPQAAAILEPLGDNRLLIDPADHIVAYKTAAGAILNAKTGAPIASVDPAAFKKV